MNTRHLALAAVAALLLPLTALPQGAPGSDAVSWTSRAEAVKGKDGERLYRLQFEGRIADGYIVYGPDFDAELGPRPTRLRLDDAESVKARDALQPTGTRRGSDKVFKSEYTYFAGQARLTQTIAVAAGVDRVSGRVVGQTCHEADGTCSLFNSRFEITLPR